MAKYKMVEINRCAFQKDARIASQLPINTAVFNETTPLENGTLVGIDEVNGYITTYTTALHLGLHYSSEETYDVREGTLGDFAITDNEGFYPRVGYVEAGDIFTTNAVEGTISTTSYSAGTDLTVNTKGYLTTAGTDGTVVAQVIKVTTLPNGDAAVKVVIK